jgi:hypothetical protein
LVEIGISNSKQYMQERQLLDQCNTDGIQKIVVGAVIKYNNKCLCVKRVSDDFMGGLVELPSGGKDQGEGIIEIPDVILNPKEHSEYYWLRKDKLDEYNISDHTKTTILRALV